MDWEEFFRPKFAKILWFMAFFIISFESLWVRILCIKGSCNRWYVQLAFLVFAWPFALKEIILIQGAIPVIIATLFFIFVPLLYYYLLACLVVRVLPKVRSRTRK